MQNVAKSDEVTCVAEAVKKLTEEASRDREEVEGKLEELDQHLSRLQKNLSPQFHDAVREELARFFTSRFG